MADKGFKTHQELISILRGRGMSIEEGTAEFRALQILEKENYYNVINGYKDLFLDPASTSTAELYKTGTTFDEVYALYDFDREVRHIYLKYLLKVENAFKTVLAHEFSLLYGHDNYLKLENFYIGPSTDQNVLQRIAKTHKLNIKTNQARVEQISSEENIGAVIQLFGDIQQEIARQMSKHHQVVTHYISEHGYIPLWVLVNVLTFGKITTFYNLMKPDDKVAVAKKFRIAYIELHKYMNMCSLARNQCAHDERFYSIRFRSGLHMKSIPEDKLNVLNLPRGADDSYISGTNDAYAIAIIFARLLSKTDTKEFVSAMNSAFGKLEKQLHTISVDDIMKKMGYCGSWENLPDFQ